MKSLLILFSCILIQTNAFNQGNSTYNNTVEINKRLKILSTPTPDSQGGVTFDNSYEGIRGGPCLFEKAVKLLLKVRESEFYIPLEANLDLTNSTLIYKDNSLNQLLSIPCDRIVEMFLVSEEKVITYRTTKDKLFKPGMNETRFFQILKETPHEFIKIPFKVLVPADYKGAYSAERRYDEYKTEFRYYILGEDYVYHHVFLNRRSLYRLFPGKKEIIKSAIKEKVYSSDEDMVINVLGKL